VNLLSLPRGLRVSGPVSFPRQSSLLTHASGLERLYLRDGSVFRPFWLPSSASRQAFLPRSRFLLLDGNYHSLFPDSRRAFSPCLSSTASPLLAVLSLNRVSRSTTWFLFLGRFFFPPYITMASPLSDCKPHNTRGLYPSATGLAAPRCRVPFVDFLTSQLLSHFLQQEGSSFLDQLSLSSTSLLFSRYSRLPPLPRPDVAGGQGPYQPTPPHAGFPLIPFSCTLICYGGRCHSENFLFLSPTIEARPANT